MSFAFHGELPTAPYQRTITLYNNQTLNMNIPNISGCYMVKLDILDLLFRISGGGVIPQPIVIMKWNTLGNYRSEDGQTEIYIPVSNPSASTYVGGFQQHPYNILLKEGKYIRDSTVNLDISMLDTNHNVIPVDFVHIRYLLTVSQNITQNRNDKFLSQILTE